ncbi:MAG TPA: Clp protease N-terminal domain-containing protein [Longimicrobiales bacterium]
MFGWKRPKPEDPYPFTDRVRKVLVMAREEAIRLQHDHVRPEHLLLGLIRDRGGMAVTVLANLRIDPQEVRKRVEEAIPKGQTTVVPGELLYTEEAKKALEYAIAEARELNSYIGTEHVLLGVAAAGGIAAEVLGEFGATPDVLKAVLADAGGARRAVGKEAARAAAVPRFRIRIDDSAPVSIYEQIIAQVQEAVATGQLRPGDRLPTVRRLADDLDIAPGTVARAYAELERLGIVVSEGARGTRIAEQKKPLVADAERPDTLVGLLRPVAVAAFHLGASAGELRAALEEAMKGIYDQPEA